MSVKIITSIPTEALDLYLTKIVPTLYITDIAEHVEEFYKFNIDPDYYTQEDFLVLCQERWERHNNIEGHPV